MNAHVLPRSIASIPIQMPKRTGVSTVSFNLSYPVMSLSLQWSWWIVPDPWPTAKGVAYGVRTVGSASGTGFSSRLKQSLSSSCLAKQHVPLGGLGATRRMGEAIPLSGQGNVEIGVGS